MKIIGYATASKLGFEKYNDEISWRKKMKELHQQEILFTPRVLVEGISGESKAKWMNSNEYNRLRKKEVKDG